MKDYFIKSFRNAFIAYAYIGGVAWIMFNSEHLELPETFLLPIIMLLLFVISATVTGYLILGNPIQLYLENRKKEAFTFLSATLVWLIIFLLATLSLSLHTQS